jgi:hypothetical protein
MNQSDDLFSIHRRAWDLIPWVVNGRASGEERRVVEQHLADCGDCREEHEFQLRLHTAMSRAPRANADADANADSAAAASLQRLWQRIDGEDAVPVMRRRTSSSFARGLLAAVLIEAVGIAALSSALWTRDSSRSAAPLYQTLSAPAEGAAHATIRAVLAPTLTLGELQALLERTQLQIVAGPSDAGVYSLAPLSAHLAAATQPALAQLRTQPGVRFAEPVDTARSAP